MHGVAGNDVAGHVKFLQQLLNGRNLVGFLVDLDVRQHQGGVGREGAQHLSRFGVVEVVEAATKRLAVERDDPDALGRGVPVQAAGVVAKRLFDIDSLQSLQDIADRGVRGRAFPFDLEGLVQSRPVNLDEGSNAAIRIGSGDNRENGKQQYIRELVQFALGAAGIRDRRELRKQGVQRLHGNLE
jgi:hypothetical protein